MLPLWTCILIMFGFLGLAHYFRWPRRLPRTLAYALGTLIIWGAVVLRRGVDDQTLELLWFPLSAGVFVFGFYALDWALNRLSRMYIEWQRGRDGPGR